MNYTSAQCLHYTQKFYFEPVIYFVWELQSSENVYFLYLLTAKQISCGLPACRVRSLIFCKDF